MGRSYNRQMAGRTYGFCRPASRRAVSADTAMRLGRYFNTSAEFWMNLQTMHDLTKAKQEKGKAIEREATPRAA
jgi:antitoxin HigA-1